MPLSHLATCVMLTERWMPAGLHELRHDSAHIAGPVLGARLHQRERVDRVLTADARAGTGIASRPDDTLAARHASGVRVQGESMAKPASPTM